MERVGGVHYWCCHQLSGHHWWPNVLWNLILCEGSGVGWIIAVVERYRIGDRSDGHRTYVYSLSRCIDLHLPSNVVQQVWFTQIHLHCLYHAHRLHHHCCMLLSVLEYRSRWSSRPPGRLLVSWPWPQTIFVMPPPPVPSIMTLISHQRPWNSVSPNVNNPVWKTTRIWRYEVKIVIIV